MIYSQGAKSSEAKFKPKKVLTRDSNGNSNLFEWLPYLKDHKKGIWKEGEIYKRLNPEAAAGADRILSPEIEELQDTIAALDEVEDRKSIAKYKLDLSRAKRADLLLEQSCFYDIYNDWISDASRAYLRDYRNAEL
jgi:hypothetical protein